MYSIGPENNQNEATESSLSTRRKQLERNLIISIIVIFGCVLGIYYSYKIGRNSKILGIPLIAIMLGAIYRVFGVSLIEMDSYEKDYRASHPLPCVSSDKVRKKALIYTAIAIGISVLIIVLSYL